MKHLDDLTWLDKPNGIHMGDSTVTYDIRHDRRTAPYQPRRLQVEPTKLADIVGFVLVAISVVVTVIGAYYGFSQLARVFQ